MNTNASPDLNINLIMMFPTLDTGKISDWLTDDKLLMC